MGGLQIATWGFSCQLFRQTSCKDRKGRGRGPAIARLWKGVRLCPSHLWDALALTLGRLFSGSHGSLYLSCCFTVSGEDRMLVASEIKEKWHPGLLGS